MISRNAETFEVAEKSVIKTTTEPTPVYNFQVADFHTYHVGKNCIWVHNAQCPVPEAQQAANGLYYKSNPKHTQGQPGNRPNAGIEPQNSLALFEKSQPSSIKPNQRYAYDEFTKTLHRFFPSNNEGTEWHWSGSTNQGNNSLYSKDVPRDIKNLFGLKSKGW